MPAELESGKGPPQSGPPMSRNENTEFDMGVAEAGEREGGNRGRVGIYCIGIPGGNSFYICSPIMFYIFL